MVTNSVFIHTILISCDHILTIDVGTNKSFDDVFYIGLKQKRTTRTVRIL